MALPSSGSISLSQINTELNRSATANISLDTAENGGYATINGCSIYRPLSSNPASMSEWYSYNHTATCTLCNTDISLNFSANSTTYYNTSQNFNITSLGDFTPVLIIDSTTANVTVSIAISDPLTGGLGDFYLQNIGAGTYTFEELGVFTTGVITYAMSIWPAAGGTVTGSIRMKVLCPTTLSCGNTLNSIIPSCGSTWYHWVDLGTTSRTVTMTYTAPSPGGGTLSIAVNYAGSNLSLSGSTNWGTNQSFSFTYTYNGTTTIARVAFSVDGWC